MSPILAEMRRTHAAQRGISQGASITLAAHVGGYAARFDCATKCALALGDKHLTIHGIAPEVIPLFHIPMEEVFRAITKLTETFSVALVDTVTDEKGTRFVLLWRIAARSDAELATVPVPDANQGSLDLDEY